MKPWEQKCALRELANEQAQVLKGLTFTGDSLGYEKGFLGCCDGLGHYYDEAKGLSQACDLKRRKHWVERLCQQFKATWKQDFKPNRSILNPTEQSFLGQTFRDYLAGVDKKGQVFTTYTKAQDPSLKLWHFSFLATWNYGIPSFVLSLGENLPLNREYFSESPVSPILFLEQKASFLLADYAIEFGSIVNWCEQHDVPLWVDLLQLSPKAAARSKIKGFDALAAYQEKIDEINSRPPLRALGLDCKSRLRSVCKNIDLYM